MTASGSYLGKTTKTSATLAPIDYFEGVYPPTRRSMPAMRQGFSHPLSLSLSLAVILSGLIWPSAVVGQVTIKERVEIHDASRARVNFLANSSSVGVPVAPFDGVVRVSFYGPAHRFIVPFTTSDSVTILLNGVDKASTAVLDHYALNSSILSDCGGNGTYYGYTVPGVTSTWLPIQVSEGDTLDFADGVGQAMYSQQSDSVWDSSLEATCNLNVYYSRIPFGVEVVRDSLQLEFITAPGDTLPEPGTHITARAIVRGASGNGKVRFEISNHDYPDPANAPDSLIWFLVGNDTLATPQEVSMDVDTADVTLVSTTYWGAVDVTAKYIVGTDSTSGRTERWPIDIDEDGIGDLWEIANGGLNLNSSQSRSTDAGCPPAGQPSKDGCWDEESTSAWSNTNDGDGIDKLREYRGVRIGTSYTRLDPLRKEIFLDTDSTSVGSFVISELESQLGLTVYEVGGLVEFGSPTFPGSAELEYQGLGVAESPSKNYLRALENGVPHKGVGISDTLRHQNGEVVHQGTYVLDGVSVGCASSPWCQDSMSMQGEVFGMTPRGHQLLRRWARSVVYDETVSNVWSASVNSIPESATEFFQFIVAMPNGSWDGYELFTATFNNTNLDGTPGAGQYVNPFDLLGWGAYNNASSDGQVVGLSETEYLQRVLLHEIGHALGIRVKGTCIVVGFKGDCHPKSGQSVMRQGFGPAKSKFFSNVERADMKLKAP